MKEHASRHAELGNFLKTRRANITPAQIGLPAGIRRRTPGLRREEVAALAGIGLTWYTWLEQGRDIQVSPQVIHSLARILMLNEEETHHLYVLANQPVPLQPPPYRQIVPAALQRILDSLPFSPSLILDTRWNILAWNTAATAVFTDFQAIDIASRNYIWLMFTNPHYKEILDHWDRQARSLAARFRAECDTYIEDPWVTAFIKTLCHESKEFAAWWSLHEIATEKTYNKIFHHPAAGKLTFEHSSFFVSDNMTLKVFINTPAPGTDTAYKMKQLLQPKS